MEPASLYLERVKQQALTPTRRLSRSERGPDAEQGESRGDDEVDQEAEVEKVVDQMTETEDEADPDEAPGEADPGKSAIARVTGAQQVHSREKQEGERSGKRPKQGHRVAVIRLIRAEAVSDAAEGEQAAKYAIENFQGLRYTSILENNQALVLRKIAARARSRHRSSMKLNCHLKLNCQLPISTPRSPSMP